MKQARAELAFQEIAISFMISQYGKQVGRFSQTEGIHKPKVNRNKESKRFIRDLGAVTYGDVTKTRLKRRRSRDVLEEEVEDGCRTADPYNALRLY